MKDLLDPEELAALPRQFIAISRPKFRLAVWERPATSRTLVKTFGCSCGVGLVRHRTPGGPFFVLAKARNPDWLMPDSSWVPEEQRGVTVSGTDPTNPIKEAFLKLTPDGVGIHGTDNLLSLGSRASHGCIRVKPNNAIWLYNRVAVGSPVYIT